MLTVLGHLQVVVLGPHARAAAVRGGSLEWGWPAAGQLVLLALAAHAAAVLLPVGLWDAVGAAAIHLPASVKLPAAAGGLLCRSGTPSWLLWLLGWAALAIEH